MEVFHGIRPASNLTPDMVNIRCRRAAMSAQGLTPQNHQTQSLPFPPIAPGVRIGPEIVTPGRFWALGLGYDFRPARGPVAWNAAWHSKILAAMRPDLFVKHRKLQGVVPYPKGISRMEKLVTKPPSFSQPPNTAFATGYRVAWLERRGRFAVKFRQHGLANVRPFP